MECFICTAPYAEFETRCGHYFHFDCLKKCKSSFCPRCSGNCTDSADFEKFIRDNDYSSINFLKACKRIQFINYCIIENNLGLFSILIENFKWNDSMNFLSTACEFGCPEMVTKLISLGADIMYRSAGGRVPLHYAAESGAIECFEVLIRFGANVNIPDFINCFF